MTRKEAREALFILVFEMGIQKETPEYLTELFYDFNKVDPKSREYIEYSLGGIYSRLAEIDGEISKHSGTWKLDRISKVTLAILRLGVFELLYNDSVPNPVAINEAVELAKVYAEEEAPKFLNGILATIQSGIQMQE